MACKHDYRTAYVQGSRPKRSFKPFGSVCVRCWRCPRALVRTVDGMTEADFAKSSPGPKPATFRSEAEPKCQGCLLADHDKFGPCTDPGRALFDNEVNKEANE